MKPKLHLLTVKSTGVFAILFAIACSGVTAQVPLQDDPCHKVVLENAYLRLLDGRVPAHDTTLLHTHAANSVVVFLSKSKFGIQNAGLEPVVTEVNPGDVVYRAYGEKPVNHKVWDESNSLFHFWVAELPQQQLSRDTCSVLPSTVAELLWQEKRVSAYKLKIDKSQLIGLPKSNCAYLLIPISGTTSVGSAGRIRSLQDGGFFFFSPQSEVKITGGPKEKAVCVLLEIK